MMTIAKINWVLLNKGADLFFDGDSVAVPFGQSTAKDLPATLDRLAADVVSVEYRTIADPKAREQDRKKFSKRLAGLGDGWVIGEWANKVTQGFVAENTMQCTITRTRSGATR